MLLRLPVRHGASLRAVPAVIASLLSLGFAGPALADACVAPGTQVLTDPAGDQTGGASNAALDIQSVSFAEPNWADGVRRLTITMKVASLATVPQSASWRVNFTPPGSPAVRYYVSMNTSAGNSTPTFTYGSVAGTQLTTLGAAEPFSGYNADGTITLVINDAKVGNPAPGAELAAIQAVTQQFVGAAGAGGYVGVDSTPAAGPSYTMVAADACPIVDADGDSVVDGNDACPNTPPNTPVRPDGCPIVINDSDGDGITDGDDLCPDTPDGTPVDVNGCPVGPPEFTLHFHGNTHEGTPACSGNGPADAVTCGGPFLKASAALDSAAPAHFEDSGVTVNPPGTGANDPNWTWTATAATTVQGKFVVRFWASCSSACVTLGAVWDVTLWKNGTQVQLFNDVGANPETGDLPSLLTFSLELQNAISLAQGDKLTLNIRGGYTVDNANTRVYYDSTQACAPGGTGPCDSFVVFNAKDSDADGVPDIIDECEGTPPGITVDETGCPATASCAAAGAQAAIARVPTSGPVRIDDVVRADWAALGDAATYGAFVHFYRQGTPFAQDWVLQQLGLKITHDFRRSSTIVFARGPVSAFKALAAHPWVRRIEANAQLHYHDATQSWATRARVAHEPVSGGPYYDNANPPNRLTGKGVTLGVMDSGLFGAHPDFAGRISHNFKYTGTATYVDVMYGDSENGGGGHGTHVTGTAAGDGTQSDGGYPDPDAAPLVPGTFASASPEANIIHWGHGAGLFVLNVQVAYQHLLDNIGTEKFQTLRAVNNSYGDTGGTAYNPDNANQQLINQIVGCNVNMVFSAGNNGGNGSADTTSSYCKNPTPGVICVASYNDMGMGTRDGPLSTFSSRGLKGKPDEYPDIAAPGDLTTSTCAQATPTQAICTGGDETRAETEWQPWYGTISGTSMASPNITGVIGIIAQAAPDLDAGERELLLQRTARRVNLDGDYVNDPQNDGYTIHFGYGAGLVDVVAALDELGTTKAELPPQGEALTIFAADADPALAGAADIEDLVMQEYLAVSGAHGVEYRLTVRDATAFGASSSISYKIEQNVNGRLYETTVQATAAGVAVLPEGAGNTAPAVDASREGNVISFRVPYNRLGYPPVTFPIHNIVAFTSDATGVLDSAPSPFGVPGSRAREFPMFGRPFTVRLSSGDPPEGNSCIVPGIETNIDLPADSTAENGAHEIRSVYFAEPLLLNGASMDGKFVATIKVGSMPVAPPDTLWSLRFDAPEPPANGAVGYFIGLSTADGGERFVWGTYTVDSTPAATVTTFEIQGDIDNENSYYTDDGTIVLVADKALFGVDTGDKLDTIVGRVGAASSNEGPINGMNATAFDSTSAGAYWLRGNDICRLEAPIAALEADVTAGNAPVTVTFDASGSTATDATIVSYTFDFGDGNDPVTQDTPTIQHTYMLAGSYTATLSVLDSNGMLSSNVAQVVIDVVLANLAPVADAGLDFEVAEGTGVLLAGRATDTNGDTLSYQWTQVSGPAVALGSADTASASFTAPRVTADAELVFRLTVDDGKGGVDTDEVMVRVLQTDPKRLGNSQVGGFAPLSVLLLGLLGAIRRKRRQAA